MILRWILEWLMPRNWSLVIYLEWMWFTKVFVWSQETFSAVHWCIIESGDIVLQTCVNLRITWKKIDFFLLYFCHLCHTHLTLHSLLLLYDKCPMIMIHCSLLLTLNLVCYPRIWTFEWDFVGIYDNFCKKKSLIKIN